MFCLNCNHWSYLSIRRFVLSTTFYSRIQTQHPIRELGTTTSREGWEKEPGTATSMEGWGKGLGTAIFLVGWESGLGTVILMEDWGNVHGIQTWLVG